MDPPPAWVGLRFLEKKQYYGNGSGNGRIFFKRKKTLINRKSWIAQQVASTDKIRTHPRNPSLEKTILFH